MLPIYMFKKLFWKINSYLNVDILEGYMFWHQRSLRYKGNHLFLDKNTAYTFLRNRCHMFDYIDPSLTKLPTDHDLKYITWIKLFILSMVQLKSSTTWFYNHEIHFSNSTHYYWQIKIWHIQRKTAWALGISEILFVVFPAYPTVWNVWVSG